MNKQLVLACLIICSQSVYAAEQKDEGKKYEESLLLFKTIDHYKATNTLPADDIQKLIEATPVKAIRAGHRLSWLLEVPQGAKLQGCSVLEGHKIVGITRKNCSSCPQVRAYKVPVSQENGTITYAQILVGHMEHSLRAYGVNVKTLSCKKSDFQSCTDITQLTEFARAIKRASGAPGDICSKPTVHKTFQIDEADAPRD